MNRYQGKGRVRVLVRAAMIAAIYVLLCVLFAPSSSAPVQLRVSEALTLLVVFCPEAIAGVTVGCFFSNMLLSVPIDMAVGTAATLLAGLWSYRLRNRRWKGLAVAASLPPVLLNMVMVGIELTLLYYGSDAAAGIWLMNALTVGLGQAASCSVLGVLLVYVIEKNPAAARLFRPDQDPSSPGV